MRFSSFGAAGIMVIACVAGTAVAAGVTPIASEGRAARAVVSAVLLNGEALTIHQQFAYQSLDVIDRGLRQLRASTTFAELAAAPDGIVVPCPASGSLTARVSRNRPRVLSFAWNECAREELYRTVLNGPAEVTLIADSLTPSWVAAIRFGDRRGDLVETTTPMPELPPGVIGTTVGRNLRLTGVLPMERVDEHSAFPGRYTFALTGFYHLIEHIPDWSSGEPSVERYDFDHFVSTDGALVSGELDNPAASYEFDFRLLWGRISARYVVPVTPIHPAVLTYRKWIEGTDLHVHEAFDQELQQYRKSIDGKVDVDFNEWLGFACGSPDTFVYRTQKTLTHAASVWTGHVFDGGALSINGNTTATFSSTGSQPYSDLLGQIALDVRGVGNFAYPVTDFIYSSPIFLAASCTP